MSSKRIYGIDLGTTYSCISFVDESGKPVVIPNVEGDLTTPSVVYFESADNIVVGKQAKNSSRLFPDRTVAFVKRFMGDARWEKMIDGRAWKPEEISARILRKVVDDASDKVGEPITDVVITCPAYFGVNEREATKNAGRIAGLNVRHILNEPTSAAIAYGMDKKGDSVILVYDLGGGTFDVTLIQVREGAIQVLYTDGNHALGGKDWDDRIANHLAQQFINEHPDAGDPRDDPEALQDLALGAEEVKQGLSAKEKVPRGVSRAGIRSGVVLTRDQFEQLTADLLEQTMKYTEGAIQAAADAQVKIDKLLLVGGSSKMPYVRRTLQERFGLDGQMFDPDQAVAKGAAIQGMHILAGDMVREEIGKLERKNAKDIDLKTVDRKILERAAANASAGAGSLVRMSAGELMREATRVIVNVASRSFGVVALNNDDQRKVFHLVHAQQRLPAETTDTFYTKSANTRAIEILVMESESRKESPELDANREICKGDLKDLPPNLPKGAPIEVTFRLVEDGTLDVTAIEPGSRRELKLQVSKIDGVMTDEEVDEARSILRRESIS